MSRLDVRRVVACLSEAVWSQREAAGRIHSVYQHAVNIELDLRNIETRLLTIVVQGEYLPDSLQISQHDFETVRALSRGDPVQWNHEKLFLSSHEFKQERSAWSGKMSIRLSNPSALSTILQAMEPIVLNIDQRYRTIAEETIRHIVYALNVHRPDEAAALCERVVGLGRGLTPSCDDALVGMLAVLWIRGPFPPFLSNRLLARTSDVSVKYLRCAQDGYFSKRVLDVLEAPNQSAAATARALNRVVRWGASSGKDMLWGMRTALEEMYCNGYRSANAKALYYKGLCL